MKLNKPTMQYIRTLIENKADERIKELRAEIERIKKPYVCNKNAYIEAVNCVLEETKRKLEALVKKYGYEKYGYEAENKLFWKNRRVEALYYTEVGLNPNGEDKEYIDILHDRIYRIAKSTEEKYNEVIAKITLGGDKNGLVKLIDEIEF